MGAWHVAMVSMGRRGGGATEARPGGEGWLHPNKNAHHKEKAEGLFKQIGKAKDGLLDTEARRRHDADIQRGDRRQQREVRHCNRGAATHDHGQEGRRPGEPNTLTMQRRFAYVTLDFMEAQYTSIVRAASGSWPAHRCPT